MRKILLFSGTVASIVYVAANIVVPPADPHYSVVSQTVSELSAVGAPTRRLWLIFVIPYGILLITFGLGVWKSARDRVSLKIAGAMIASQGTIGFFWPPMHMRGIEFTLTDTLHIVWAIVVVPLMMIAIGSTAMSFGRWFQIYSLATMSVLIVFGTVTALDGPKIAANLPTPNVGVWERISIGGFVVWMIVLSAVLLHEGDDEGRPTR